MPIWLFRSSLSQYIHIFFYGVIGSGGSGGGQKKSLHVNVDGSKRAVRLGHEAKDKAIDVLVELDRYMNCHEKKLLLARDVVHRWHNSFHFPNRQEEQLDRIETTIDNVHANLDKGDRLIRGISSVGGATKNLVTLDKTKNNNPKYVKREHMAQQKWKKEGKPIELDILLKLQGNDYAEALLSFGKEKFFVKDKASGKRIAGHAWTYDMVKYIVMRARPLHMDVRFADNSPRFRCMTRYANPSAIYHAPSMHHTHVALLPSSLHSVSFKRQLMSSSCVRVSTAQRGECSLSPASNTSTTGVMPSPSTLSKSPMRSLAR